MSRFDKGVTSYTYATAEINVAFPEDEVKCKWCPFIKHYDSLDRDKCALTNDILYSRDFRGHNCPLVIINQVKIGDV